MNILRAAPTCRGLSPTRNTLIVCNPALFLFQTINHWPALSGKEYFVYAGRECARALAKGSVDPKDVGSADLSDLSEEELQRLDARLEDFKAKKYHPAGKVSAAALGGSHEVGRTDAVVRCSGAGSCWWCAVVEVTACL